MKRLSLKIISDLIFIILGSFLTLLSLLSLVLEPLVCLVVSITLSLTIGVFAFSIILRKNDAKRVLRRDKKLMEDTFSTLEIYTDNKVVGVFLTAFSRLNVNAKRVKNGVFLVDENTLIIFRLGFNKVTKTDVVKAFNLIKKGETATFYTEKADSDVKDFISRFSGRIKIEEKESLFNKLKTAELLPLLHSNDYLLEKEKPRLVSGLTNRKNSRKLFLFGFVFLVFSFISPIKIYYIIWGALMMILAVFIKLFGNCDQAKN